jgi:hypothetical protein
MQRTTPTSVIAGPRDLTRDPHDRPAAPDPSYVQSILFGRRWARASRTPRTAELKAGAVNEQGS